MKGRSSQHLLGLNSFTCQQCPASFPPHYVYMAEEIVNLLLYLRFSWQNSQLKRTAINYSISSRNLSRDTWPALPRSRHLRLLKTRQRKGTGGNLEYYVNYDYYISVQIPNTNDDFFMFWGSDLSHCGLRHGTIKSSICMDNININC